MRLRRLFAFRLDSTTPYQPAVTISDTKSFRSKEDTILRLAFSMVERLYISEDAALSAESKTSMIRNRLPGSVLLREDNAFLP